MKIYVVVSEFPEFGEPGHVVIAKNASEAVEMTVNYLNQSQTGHLYKTSDFSFSDINVDKFSDPTIIF